MRAIKLVLTFFSLVFLTINGYSGSLGPVNSVSNNAGNGHPCDYFDDIFDGVYVLIKLNKEEQVIWEMPSNFSEMYLTIKISDKLVWVSNPITTFRQNGEKCGESFFVYSSPIEIPSAYLESQYPCTEQMSIIEYEISMYDNQNEEYVPYHNIHNFWGGCDNYLTSPTLWYTYGCRGFEDDPCSLDLDDSFGEFDPIDDGSGTDKGSSGNQIPGGSEGGRGGDFDNENGEVENRSIFGRTVTVFPNPFENTIQINSTFENISTLVVLDINGRIMFSLDSRQDIINTENWANGLYLIKYVIDGEIGTKKILKQR